MSPRNHLAVLLAIMLAAGVAWAGSTVIVIKRPSVGGCTNTSILTWWRAETTTHTTGDFPSSTTAWTLGVAGAAATLASDAANTTALPASTTGLHVIMDATNLSNAELAVSADDRVDADAGRIGFWFKYKKNAGAWVSKQLFYLGPGTTRYIRFNTGTTEGALDLIYRDQTPLVAAENTLNCTAPCGLADDTWAYIEAIWDVTQAGGSDILRIKVDGVTKAESTTRTLIVLSTAPTTFRLGNAIGVGASATTYHFDNLIVSSDPAKDLYTDCRTREAYP